ncbi:conserved hypothetical protein [Mycoplasma haemofelis str. Langford 1]|uniref:Uncharacterized protein n=1 Tax=Mycoplasma haemofelis (strain Langford 1) TaxID=941640 RepID=E8ZK99_MYCHL|nr:lysylphosphatidylglycerol synthase domain-containing protein [Mycoplasma haemofelis]CBY92065.1 conserved hypothetical protein [Mycoplasma haemofelis str. Langford 1]
MSFFIDNNPNTNSSCSHIKYVEEAPNFISRFIQLGVKNKMKVGNENFFNYKKKRAILVWCLVFFFVILLAVKFVLKLELLRFISRLYQASGSSYFLITLVLGFLAFFVCEITLKVVSLKTQAYGQLDSVSKFEWFGFSSISFFIQSITPFSVGSEPYSIWWLNKKGIDLKEAGAMVAVASCCWFVAQFLVTWPSFIYITVQNWDKVSSLDIPNVYWAILGGLFVDITVGLLIFSVSYFKTFHYLISKWVNRIKRWLALPYAGEEELAIKYLEQNAFQKIYVRQIKRFTTVKIAAFYFFCNVYLYFLFVLIHRIFNQENWDGVLAYNVINVSTTANNFMPLPSAEGSLQVVMKNLLEGFGDSSAGRTDEESIFLWRFFSKYFGFILSLIFLSMYGINTNTRRRKEIRRECRSAQTSLELIF